MKIVLIGFMGSGKTSIAIKLAKKLNLKFIDMDELILTFSGLKSINEIFDKMGEKGFREIETKIAKEISEEDNVVISTGGGVIMDKQTMSYLSKNSQIIFLKLSFNQANIRVSQKAIRPPLFQNIDSAKKLFDIRQPLYLKYAAITIDTEEKSVDEVVDDIIVKLSMGEKNGR